MQDLMNEWHKMRLEHVLSTFRPDILVLQEAWLKDIEEIRLPGYGPLVDGRRDREDEPKLGYGGIIFYVRVDADVVASLGHPSEAERSWFTIFTHVGPVVLCN